MHTTQDIVVVGSAPYYIARSILFEAHIYHFNLFIGIVMHTRATRKSERRARASARSLLCAIVLMANVVRRPFVRSLVRLPFAFVRTSHRAPFTRSRGRCCFSAHKYLYEFLFISRKVTHSRYTHSTHTQLPLSISISFVYFLFVSVNASYSYFLRNCFATCDVAVVLRMNLAYLAICGETEVTAAKMWKILRFYRSMKQPTFPMRWRC